MPFFSTLPWRTFREILQSGICWQFFSNFTLKKSIVSNFNMYKIFAIVLKIHWNNGIIRSHWKCVSIISSFMKNFKIATDNPLCTKIYYSNIWKTSDFSHFPTFQHCHPGLQNNQEDNELVNFQQWRNGQLWMHLDIYLFWRIRYQKEKHVLTKYLVIVFPAERRTNILLEKQEVKYE